MALKENYKDDILDVSQNVKRKYQMENNGDGTVSFTDVTEYLQEGDSFGSSDLNAMAHAINNISSDAEHTSYDNTESGLISDNVQGAIDEINDNLTELENKALVYNSSDDTYGVIINDEYYAIGKAGIQEIDMLRQEAGYWTGSVGAFEYSGYQQYSSSQSGTFTPYNSLYLTATENAGGGSPIYSTGYKFITTSRMNLSNFNKLKLTFSSKSFGSYSKFQVAIFDAENVQHTIYNDIPSANDLEFDISSYGVNCKVGVCVFAIEGGVQRSATCTISSLKATKEE